MYKKLLSAALLAVGITSAHASNIQSVKSGFWNDPTVWSNSLVPTANDDITIKANHNVQVDNTGFVNKLVVETSAIFSTWSNIGLTISGDLEVNGTMQLYDGNINFITPGKKFKLGNGATFIWDPGFNTLSGATLWTNAVEEFAPSSNLIMKKWYNYTGVPLTSVVSGSFGNLSLTTKSGLILYEWNMDDGFATHPVLGTLTIEMAWVTLSKTGTLSPTSINNIVLSSPNSYLVLHSGNVLTSATLNTENITNTSGNLWGVYNGNGNITINVNNNFVNNGNTKLIYNDGLPGVGNGNVTLNVNQTYTQTSGDFRGIYNVSSTNAGSINFTFRNLSYTGGVFFAHYGCDVAGKNNTITVTENMNLTMSNSLDKWRGIGLSTLTGSLNNSKFNLTVNGTLTIGGSSNGEFTTSAGYGEEIINVKGNLVNNGTEINFNYGAIGVTHPTTLNFDQNITNNSGTINFSRFPGSLTTTVKGNLVVNGGTVSYKSAEGTVNMDIQGALIQTGGAQIIKNTGLIATSGNATLTIGGNFTHTGGTFTWDSHASGFGQIELNLTGPNITLGGTGSITSNASITNNTISYKRAGTTLFSRTSSTHNIQNIRQVVETGATLNIVSGALQIASQSTATYDMLRVSNGARIELNRNQILSNATLANSGLRVDAGGILATGHPLGLYNGTTTAGINSTGSLAFMLDPLSTVMYNGTTNQIITGINNGMATGTSQKYGVLEINFGGIADSEYTYLTNANVYVRKNLVLTKGELRLNGNMITIENGLPGAIAHTNGYIKSEDNDGTGASIVKWRFINSGVHTIPFGYNSTTFLPVSFTPTSGLGAEWQISTRATSANNKPFPTTTVNGPVASMNMVNTTSDISVTSVIDRYWVITASGLTANVTLSYRGEENTIEATRKTGTMLSQHWDGTKWTDLNGTSTGVVSGIGTMTINTNNRWGAVVVASNSPSPLPIELISFSAKANTNIVNLYWSTRTETNNDYFTIERSRDGRSFVSWKKIKGAGNSIHQIDYKDIDETPYTGTSYYRLRQTDFDGRTTVSNIVAVNFKNGASIVALDISKIGPNPFTNGFQMNYEIENASEVEIYIMSLQGKMVKSEKVWADAGTNKYDFDRGSDLAPGTYLVNVKSNGQSTTKKIVKN